MRVANIAAAVLLVGVVGAAPAVSAQQANIFANPQNLQVLPQDISPDDLRDTMRTIALSLGTRCTHCHVGEEGKPLTTYEFYRDDKEPKRVAREMLKMVGMINARVADIRKDADHTPVEVRCVTCHRGQVRPLLLSDVLFKAVADGGAEAAVSQYKALRERYYGRDTYDFGMVALAEVADKLLEQGQSDAGLALHKLNLEYFPDEARAHVNMGAAYQFTGDAPAAIAEYRKVLELNPQLNFVQSRIDFLQAKQKEQGNQKDQKQ